MISSTRITRWLFTLICSFYLSATCYCAETAAWERSAVTEVVMLGTGTPFSDPQRSGPSVAIVVNDTPYLVDFGPGVIRRAAAASPEYGGKVVGLDVANIRHAFLTHLHSDHSVGYPDLIFSPWTLGRDKPLEVYGPEGTVQMTKHVLTAWGEDVRYRLYGLEPTNNQGWRVNAHDISEGIIYKDENVTVEAFSVRHGSWPNAFGYRFTTPDRVIVISGDAAPSESVEKYSLGADILIHEVYSKKGLDERDTFWKTYHSNNHTSGVELGKIAERARPKLLILYHILFFGSDEEQIIDEIKQNFDGNVVMANDLDVY